MIGWIDDNLTFVHVDFIKPAADYRAVQRVLTGQEKRDDVLSGFSTVSSTASKVNCDWSEQKMSANL